MPSTPYFSLPLYTSHRPLSLRAARFRQSRKRKRDEQEEEGDSGSTTDDKSSGSRPATAGKGRDHEPISEFTPVTQRSLAALAAPVDARQYQAAGQSSQKPLPESPFPHRPVYPQDEPGPGRGNATSRVCQDELANLSPPLFVPNPSYTNASVAAPQQHSKLRLRHLSILTTIFHRCVLDGDFLRAGRAWGMILRAESGGKGAHLRKEGRWGIGAEILLRRDTEVSMLDDTSERENGEEGDKQPDYMKHHMGTWFTRQGFEKAKEYYERLILQYQFRKWVPHSVSSLDFYPAMFGTWVYMVQAEYKTGQNGSREQLEALLLQDNRLSGSESTSSPDRQDRLHEKHASELENLRQKSLREAEEISARMDELMLSPPYSDSPQLWGLRGMISLWISDLCIANRAIRESSIEQDIGNVVETSVSRRIQEQTQRRRNEEIRKAKTAFERARRGGADIGEGYMPLLEDSINDLSDQSGAMGDAYRE
ncbi:MAG: hypothetical protein M1839_007484 [Geoglossum umbratile]|nr:MAG: hypothetical protein M1839_007484 [Geoglossum umbratile]